ncbi:MAG: hypothetical protein M3072_04130, partial [Candidatus Dormibacteraeota bacterium]|nr:hypothetical protein [Candidatus Dormibacteraeota bacterium]
MSGQVEAPALREGVGRPRRAVRISRRQLEPYALLAPAAIFMTLFFAWPAVQTLLIAFQKANGSW